MLTFVLPKGFFLIYNTTNLTGFIHLRFQLNGQTACIVYLSTVKVDVNSCDSSNEPEATVRSTTIQLAKYIFLIHRTWGTSSHRFSIFGQKK